AAEEIGCDGVATRRIASVAGDNGSVRTRDLDNDVAAGGIAHAGYVDEGTRRICRVVGGDDFVARRRTPHTSVSASRLREREREQNRERQDERSSDPSTYKAEAATFRVASCVCGGCRRLRPRPVHASLPQVSRAVVFVVNAARNAHARRAARSRTSRSHPLWCQETPSIRSAAPRSGLCRSQKPGLTRFVCRPDYKSKELRTFRGENEPNGL